jgi:hypothetical protein
VLPKDATIATRVNRLDENGPAALVRMQATVNKLPAFVSHCVHRQKTLCPPLGKTKITQALARAGLHFGATTVGRTLQGGTRDVPAASADDGGSLIAESPGQDRVATAKYPNHVVVLTVVPSASGFCCEWLPLSQHSGCRFVIGWRWPSTISPPHNGRRRDERAASRRGSPHLPGPDDCQGKGRAKVHHLRPRAAIRLLWFAPLETPRPRYSYRPRCLRSSTSRKRQWWLLIVKERPVLRRRRQRESSLTHWFRTEATHSGAFSSPSIRL